jgi:hypothetical protein
MPLLEAGTLAGAICGAVAGTSASTSTSASTGQRGGPSPNQDGQRDQQDALDGELHRSTFFLGRAVVAEVDVREQRIVTPCLQANTYCSQAPGQDPRLLRARSWRAR